MRRFLTCLLAAVLLLQFHWASAAAYCEHEGAQQPAATWHYGHHLHQHHDAGKPGNPKLPDTDCTVCHFASAQAMLPVATQPVSHRFTQLRYLPQPVRFGSVPARTPDRPQWARLA